MTVAVSISPIWNGQQFFDNNGAVLNGGKIYQYQAGSFSIEQATYSEPTGSVPNSNPIVLDASGRIPVEMYLVDGQEYNLVLKNSSDTTLMYVDNVIGLVSSSNSGGSTAIWSQATDAPTYSSGSQFVMPGDYTTQFAVGNRVQVKYLDNSFSYGTVSGSAFVDPNTLITLVNDSGVLNSSMTTVYSSLATAAAPIVDAGAVTYQLPSLYSDSNTVGYAIKNLQAGSTSLLTHIQNTYAVLVASGSPAYVASADSALNSYSILQHCTVLFSDGVLGASTLNINGIGAVSIKQYSPSGALLDPFIPAGVASEMAYDGSHWILLDSIPTLPGLTTSDFTGSNQSLVNTNGYQKLPGGLIFQWGQIAVNGGGAFHTANFGITFPTACLSAVASSDNASRVLAVQGYTSSTITVQNGGTTCHYIAIGY